MKRFEILKKPTDNAKIWRMINQKKFEDLLKTQSLFLARSDILEDTFEGSVSENKPKSILDLEDNSSYKNTYKEFNKIFKPFTYLNCWHIGEHEPIALWNNYLKDKEGLAIITNFERFLKSIKRGVDELDKNVEHIRNDILLGMVDYVDYKKEETNFDNNYLGLFFSKRKNYESENELRLLIQRTPVVSIDSKEKPNYTKQKMATKDKRGLLVPVDFNLPPSGIYLNVDLDLLIDHIVLYPNSTPEFEDTVKKIITEHGLNKSVYKSSSHDAPSF